MRSRRKPAPLLQKRRAARFAAVQALYQAENADQPMASVVAEFDAHRLDAVLATVEEFDRPSPAVDREWFRIVANGAWERRGALDAVLAGCLHSGWTLARCGYLKRACLRAGAFELAERSDVPIATVISEYVAIADLFLGGDDPAFINAVLDRAAPILRKLERAL